MRRLPSMLVVFAALLSGRPAEAAHLTYGWQDVDGINIFFREGGPRSGPTLVLLHGNPSSSIMYQELMERLSESIHVLAMDYPSFGYSDAPSHTTYRYTFENVTGTVRKFLAKRGVTRYGLYMQDYGVPIGFRLLAADPSAISFIIVQNGVIHLDGFPAAQDPNGELRRHWAKRNQALDRRRADYASKLTQPNATNWDEDHLLSPDAILLNQVSERRAGVIDARNDMWFDYGSNVASYPAWQAALKKAAPPVLVLWGSRDDFFTTPGALAYSRDAPGAEVHILDTVHFATLEIPDDIARLVGDFLKRQHVVALP